MRPLRDCFLLIAVAGCGDPAANDIVPVVAGDAGAEAGESTCPEGWPCNDGDPCTEGEVCVGGSCTWGKPKDCALPIAVDCWTGACDPASGKCIALPADDGVPCPDEPCVTGSTCQGGSCVGAPLECPPASGPCLTRMCNPVTGACDVEVPVANNAPCDDGDACTLEERCWAGACGKLVPPEGHLFFEDFSGDTSAWTFGPEWEIGPAAPSPLGDGGTGPDPALDKTPTPDNRLAGVVLGGFASTDVHSYSWLESPPVDTTPAPGTVTLGFWRWLNSDYPEFMENAVEVWDGATWHRLWQGPTNTAGWPNYNEADVMIANSWSLITHDVTPYKNQAFRFRMGFRVGALGALNVGSWNVDDIVVAAGSCTDYGCTSAVPKSCPSPAGWDGPCHVMSCDAGSGACVATPGNDGETCGDDCNPGTCQGGGCETLAQPEGALCQDPGGGCVAGVCAAGTCVELVAPDGYPCGHVPYPACSRSECQQGACVQVPDADGESCAHDDCFTGVCDAGTCVPNTVQPDGTYCLITEQPCMTGACASGACVAVAAPDGSACGGGPGDPACAVGSCVAGACQFSPAPDGAPCALEASIACRSGTCDGGACIAKVVPDGEECEIAFPSPCEVGLCEGGACTRGAKDVGTLCTSPPGTSPPPCHQMRCSAQAECVATPTPNGEAWWCDDGDPCTQGDTCVGGTCAPGSPKDCSALDGPCTVGQCDPAVPAMNKCVAQAIADGTSCSTACAPAGTCQGGACTGEKPPETLYFDEDFADNAAGWTLDTYWEIGPAKASPPPTHGHPDPDTDTTDTGDNGVAGVALGSETPVAPHVPYYLTSPTVDLSAAQGSVYLGYWRWLNCHYSPYMVETVEVFDGAGWVKLWSNGFENIEDGAWTHQAHDVTPYKNPSFQVRFGHKVGGGAYAFTSWNLDDVRLSSTPCP